MNPNFLNIRTKKYSQQVRLLNFLIRLNIFAIPLYVILVLGLTLPWLQSTVTEITYYLLNAAGMHPSVSGFLISIPIQDGTWAAAITWDCTAWKSMLAFFALVMATDYELRKKRNGLAVFIPLIFAVNIVRIFFMFFYVKTFDLANYSFVHTVVWSWGMIIVILVFWIAWLKLMTKRSRKKSRRYHQLNGH
ncbi:exosortase/archaeosortase family protein [archaeon]|nr:exosortase/archaeosortase family protein [archaeon]